MSSAEIEKTLLNIIAIEHFEGIELTEEDIKDCRAILCGEASDADLIKLRLDQYGYCNE